MNDNVSMYEYAARQKLRFQSPKGVISVEQLWDVPLRSQDGFNLDAVAKAANASLKALTEESFVQTERTPAHYKAEVTLAIVKDIIRTKLTEETAAKMRAENRVEREKLLKILAEKQDGKLSEMSERELKKQIAELEG